jgi:conjugal transfer pilus assembly protein TraF
MFMNMQSGRGNKTAGAETRSRSAIVTGGIILIALVLLSSVVLGAEGTPSYYDKCRRGWWWYEDPAKQAPEKKQSRKYLEPRLLPSLKDYTIKELYGMHPDDFHALLTELMKKAIMMPENREAMEEYAQMQDIARRRSEAYANAFVAVQRQHPEWNVLTADPVTHPGRMARMGMDMAELAETIQLGKRDFGLVFFTKKGCAFCVEQRKILNYFQEKYAWDLKEVDINTNPQGASLFRIQMVPTLLLVERKSKKHLIVATGVLSLVDIEQSLHEGIRLLDGRLRPEQLGTYEYQKGGPLDPYAPLQGPGK